MPTYGKDKHDPAWVPRAILGKYLFIFKDSGVDICEMAPIKSCQVA